MRGALTRALLALSLLALGVMLPGCGGAAEIEDIGFVLAMGVDRHEESGIKLWLQMALPSSGPEGQAQQESLPFITTGETLYQALMKAQAQSSRRIMLGHVRVVVIGERLAREGIAALLDPLVRDGSFRYRSWVVVTPDPVGEVMQVSLGGQVAANYINDLMEREAPTAGVPSSRFIDLLLAVEERGMEALLARLALAEQEDDGGGAPQAGGGPGPADTMLGGSGEGVGGEAETGGEAPAPRIPVVDGAAVFKGDRMVGWIDRRLSAAVLMLKNAIQGYTFTHELAGEGQNRAVFSLLSTNARFSIPRESLTDPARIRGSTVRVNVAGLVRLRELISSEQYLTLESLERLSADLSARVERDIRDLLHTAQAEFRSDVIGLGERFRQRMSHSKWAQVQGEWDEVFSTLNIEVTANIEIRKRGQTMRSPGQDTAI